LSALQDSGALLPQKALPFAATLHAAETMPATIDEIFAANRASGRLSLAAKLGSGVTQRARVYEQGPLRVRCPGPRRRELEAMIVNTAGGMAGGDRFAIDVNAEPGAHLLITSAAAEKVYRTLGSETIITVKLDVGPGSELAWLPQETILFDRARFKRTIEVDLAADAGLLMAEAVVFGRAGMGETLTEACLLDRWRVRRGGQLIHAETMRLDGDVAGRLAQTAVAKSCVAVASVLAVPGDEAIVAAVREACGGCRGEVGVSAWNGLALVRLVAADGAALHHDLACVLSTLRGGRLPHLWLH
jgi:urease accessory protein